MKEEEKVEILNNLWRDFCVSDSYEPGSTAKPFTVAAGLETGKIRGNEVYTCGGSLVVAEDTAVSYTHLDVYKRQMQGLYAIGSGGFWGKGLGNSVQKLSAIPEVQNDMILAAICEELGIFGAIVILILFGMLLYRLMFIAQNAPDLYGSLIVTGIFTHIALQVLSLIHI